MLDMCNHPRRVNKHKANAKLSPGSTRCDVGSLLHSPQQPQPKTWRVIIDEQTPFTKEQFDKFAESINKRRHASGVR